jgi:hypothetical protein
MIYTHQETISKGQFWCAQAETSPRRIIWTGEEAIMPRERPSLCVYVEKLRADLQVSGIHATTSLGLTFLKSILHGTVPRAPRLSTSLLGPTHVAQNASPNVICRN